MKTGGRILVLVLFFLSGALGLIYEVTWMRLLRLAMGNTVFTSATVLTTFMAGLALGAYLAGRSVDRCARPLRLYGLLEGAIGIYALATPLLLVIVDPVYAWLYHALGDSFVLLGIGRFLVSACLLILPATLMGATLPLLSRFLSQHRESLGRDIGRLYAFNTLGAAIGAASAGFVLLPELGVTATIAFSAAGNIVVCLAALYLARRGETQLSPAREEGESGAVSDRREVARSAAVWGLAGAGFASMIYEVAWTRALAMLVGSSVYAFTLMLVAFIAGLGAGSMILSGWVDRRRNLLLFLGGLELVVGLAALMVVPLFSHLPFHMVEITTRYASSFEFLLLVQFVTIFLLMLLPTLAMGGVFPVVAKIYTRDLAGVGRAVGEAYAANTVGAVAGSFAGGFLLIPWLGVQNAILVGVGINLLIGVYFVLASKWRKGWLRGALALAAVGGAVIGAWNLPQWNPLLFNSAPYLYAYRYKASSMREAVDLEQVMTRNRRLLYSEEGMTATVTVVESGGELYLKVNGKTDASSRGDLRSQSLLAHLPLLLHEDPQQVLLIGLGSGITLGALEQHPVREIECVEISPEVVEGAKYFAGVNHRALEDPRLQLFIGDGRNHVALGQRSYDLIISQPSNLWIAGMADLFTREFFEACRQRLRKGGLVCNWVQAYSMRKRDFAAIAKTFQSVFPHVSMWESIPGGDYFLIGAEEPLALTDENFKEVLRTRGLEEDFARIGVHDAENLLASLVMQEAQLKAFAHAAPVNSDDNAILEFSAPEGMYQGLVGQEEIFQLEHLAPFRQTDLSFLAEPAGAAMQAAWSARQAVLRAQLAADREQYSSALAHLEEARELRPRDMELMRVLPQVGEKVAEELVYRQQYQQALALYQRILEVVPDEGMVHYQMGELYAQMRRDEAALEAFEKTVERAPRFVPAYIQLATLYARNQSLERAEQVCLQGLEVDPGNLDLLNELGKLQLRQRRWDGAISTFRRAVELWPKEAQLCNNLGVAHVQKREFNNAVIWFRKATELSLSYGRAFANLGEAYSALGKKKEARRALETALELEPDNPRTRRALQGL